MLREKVTLLAAAKRSNQPVITGDNRRDQFSRRPATEQRLPSNQTVSSPPSPQATNLSRKSYHADKSHQLIIVLWTSDCWLCVRCTYCDADINQ